MEFHAKTEIDTFVLHDAILVAADMQGRDLTLVFDCVIINGAETVQPSSYHPNPCNPGQDRYAEPNFSLTFHDCEIKSLLRGGCWRHNVQIMPSVYLPENQYLPVLRDHAKAESQVYHPEISEDGLFHLDLWGGSDINYDVLTLAYSSFTARWEHFGRVHVPYQAKDGDSPCPVSS